ncbi:MAG: hypothetical protein HY900_21030 [Deltaproteobacteria bacterium]|nr:hypothetical protein [Deltaproteobacteria bacterium]
MTREVEGIRPAVLKRASVEGLDEYRRFGSRTLSKIPPLWDDLRIELSAFADFLDDLP